MTPFSFKALMALQIGLLSGCAHNQTAVPIKIMVSIPCLTADQLPKVPVASLDADLAKLPDGDLILTLAADRLEYRRHSNEAQAILLACVK